MDLLPRPKQRQPPRLINARTFRLYILLLLGGFIIILTLLSYIAQPVGPDKPSCRPVWMYPSYARIKAFDESYTLYAKKYSLYLYREQGKDHIPEEKQGDGDANTSNAKVQLHGLPVLFIPGNAGSFRQARSIAARTSELYHEQVGKQEGGSDSMIGLDFFTADFNEDFTAFHGRTMLDQAEFANEAVKFILELYSNSPKSPKSVIIIAHSMGGIVSRIMPTLPNYVEDSIETILTLSSPHSAAPLTFDGDLLRIYSAVDQFWYKGFHYKNSDDNNDNKVKKLDTTREVTEIAHKRLQNMALISITGGAVDLTLPADYTTLGFLVPKTNGFTSFSSGIPMVWSPIDHLAVVWCQQLRTRIAYALLDIVNMSRKEDRGDEGDDERNDGKEDHIKWLQQRMRVFKRYFLSGYEPYVLEGEFREEDAEKEGKSFDIQVDEKTELAKENIKYSLGGGGGKEGGESNAKLYFKLNSEKKLHFTLLSSAQSTADRGRLVLDSLAQVYLCKKKFTDHRAKDGNLHHHCTSTDLLQNVIPNVGKKAHHVSDSSYDGDLPPFYNLELDSSLLSQYDYLIVQTEKAKAEDSVLTVELTNMATTHVMEGNVFSLLTIGNSIILPKDRALMTEVKVSQAWNSLFVYKVKFKTNNLYHHENENNENILDNTLNFNTFFRQYTSQPFETKWHIDVEDTLSMTMHGVAPYVPFGTQDDYSMNLQIWTGDKLSMSTHRELKITILVDLMASLKLLILRYRLTIVAFNIAIICMVMIAQLKRGYEFPNFIQTLVFVHWKLLVPIILFLIGINYIVHVSIIESFLQFVNPVQVLGIRTNVLGESGSGNSAVASQFHANLLYLGLKEKFTIVGIILYLVSYFVISVTYYIIILVGILIRLLLRFVPKRQLSRSMVKSRSILRFTKIQAITTMIILGLVTIFIPYQIVYLVCCLIQATNVIKFWPQTTRTRGNARQMFVFNYQISWLMLMLWILPINVPILIVFIHNLAVNWMTPFSSHHNVLSILPILIFVKYNNNGIGDIALDKDDHDDDDDNEEEVEAKVEAEIVEAEEEEEGEAKELILENCVDIETDSKKQRIERKEAEGNGEERDAVKKYVLGMFVVLLMFAVIYGSRYTFFIHHLFNLLCCVVIVWLYYSQNGKKAIKRARFDKEVEAVIKQS